MVVVEPLLPNGSIYARVRITVPSGVLHDAWNNTNEEELAFVLTYQKPDETYAAAARAVQGVATAAITTSVVAAMAMSSSPGPIPCVDALAFGQSMSLMQGIQAGGLSPSFKTLAASTNWMSFLVPMPWQRPSVPTPSTNTNQTGELTNRRRSLLGHDLAKHEYFTVGSDAFSVHYKALKQTPRTSTSFNGMRRLHQRGGGGGGGSGGGSSEEHQQDGSQQDNEAVVNVIVEASGQVSTYSGRADQMKRAVTEK